MLDDAEAGTSGAIVIRGELGIGKTALLGAVSELAGGPELVPGLSVYVGRLGITGRIGAPRGALILPVILLCD